ELAKKLLHRQAYGEPLGRHVLGEEDTLDRIGREHIVAHWERCFSPERMLVALAGAVGPTAVADLFERHFAGPVSWSPRRPEAGPTTEPTWFPLEFNPGRSHVEKELEQEQVAICFPGSAVVDPDYLVEQVVIGVLGGGMSARLFTE